MNRKDAVALNAYKMVIQLKLTNENIRKMEALVNSTHELSNRNDDTITDQMKTLTQLKEE
ncbi:MAG: hypothetical protein ACE5I1_08190 [bacterium]